LEGVDGRLTKKKRIAKESCAWEHAGEKRLSCKFKTKFQRISVSRHSERQTTPDRERSKTLEGRSRAEKKRERQERDSPSSRKERVDQKNLLLKEGGTYPPFAVATIGQKKTARARRGGKTKGGNSYLKVFKRYGGTRI